MSLSPFIALRRMLPLLLALLIATSGTIPAQTADTDTASVPGGSEIRMPSQERLLEISQDDRYHYNDLRDELSLWERFILWLRRHVAEWITSDGMIMFFRITGSVLFILVLVLLINQIMKGELGVAFKNRGDRPVLNLKTGKDGISVAKLSELLEVAIRKKDYHQAVRYLYQLSLHSLREKGLIQWKSDKTNYDYLHELTGHPAEPEFDRLTYFYEYVDYGDFPIDERQFATIRNVFQEFRDKLEAVS